MESDAVQVSLNSESRGRVCSFWLSAHKVEIIGRFFSVSSRRGEAPGTEQTGASVNASLPINFPSFRTASRRGAHSCPKVLDRVRYSDRLWANPVEIIFVFFVLRNSSSEIQNKRTVKRQINFFTLCSQIQNGHTGESSPFLSFVFVKEALIANEQKNKRWMAHGLLSPAGNGAVVKVPSSSLF